MRTKLLGFFLLLLCHSVLATNFNRSVSNRIDLQPDGSAVITRTERIAASDLAKIYLAHAQEVEADPKVRENFIDEISKEIYFLYGTVPDGESFGIKYRVEDDGSFSSEMSMKVPGLVRRDGKGYILSRKRMEYDGKLSQKLYSKYFEYEIDGRLFETSFLQNEKNLLETERLTEIVLPPGIQGQRPGAGVRKSPHPEMVGGFRRRQQLPGQPGEQGAMY